MQTEQQGFFEPIKFAKKPYKQSKEGRHWKKYSNVLMERDPSGIQYTDVTFCEGKAKANLMASAISARVDIYSLSQPSQAGK